MKLDPLTERKCLVLAGLEPHQAKTPKYRNRKTTIDGITFDSKKEGLRWLELLNRKMTGLITNLDRQVVFRITVNGIEVCKYVADFVYTEGGCQVVEDVKSEVTRKLAVYRLKKKLVEAVHRIKIREV